VTVAVALLVGALLAATHGQRILLAVTRSSLDPRIGIVTWLVSLASVLLTGITGVALLALPDHGGVGAMLARVGSCWKTLQHGAVPAWEEAGAGVGAVTLVALLARLTVVAVRQTRLRRQRRDRYRFLVSLAGSPNHHRTPVVWLDHPHPAAFSVAGRPGLIAATHGLRDRLGPAALAATLEHERAHLRGRHHAVLDIGDAAAAALPFAPLFRAAPTALRELVEAAADTAAVRRHGAPAVLDALRAMASAPGPGEGLGMADTAVERRLLRLSAGGTRRATPLRLIGCALAAFLATVLPGLVGVTLLLGVACSVTG
jgi:Zn-dependent protease with chaperone function